MNEIGLRIRDQARDIIRERIIAGAFADDAPLEEIPLARALGISRTPLREALLNLQQEGLVTSRPRRGFTVAPVDIAAVRELYPMLGALEALVIELSCAALKQDVPLLRQLNRALAAAPSGKAAQADGKFHETLRARCANRRLVHLLTAQEGLAHRIDGAMQRDMADRCGSVEQHVRVIDAIAAGDCAGASRAMREHWRQGEETVVQWLRERAR